MSLLSVSPACAWHRFTSAVLAVRGPDSVDLLHRLCTQNLRPLGQAGSAVDALFVTHQGKLVQRARLWSDVSGLYMAVPAGCGAAFIDYLRRYTIMEDVTYTLCGEEMSCALLLWQAQDPAHGANAAASPIGPLQARPLFARAEPTSDAAADLLPHEPSQVPSPVADAQAGAPAQVPDAFLLPAPRGFGPGLVVMSMRPEPAAAGAETLLPQLWSQVSGLGLPAAQGALGEPLSAEGLRALRLRAGVPAWREDYAEGAMPFEYRLGEGALAWNKGCYIGQEVLSRLDSYKKVARLTMGLTAGAEAATLWAAAAKGLEVRCGGQRVGRITSWAPLQAAPSALVGSEAQVVALAVVKQAFAADATAVEVHGEKADGTPLAVVAAMLHDCPHWRPDAATAAGNGGLSPGL